MAAGCRVDGNHILYPRRLAGGGQGWKVRNVTNGKCWNEPGGIKHSDTLPLMWQEDAARIIVCEGESDFLRLHGIGRDVLCCPGATAFPNGWSALLHNYADVAILPDADEAGTQLAQRVSELVPTARWVKLPQGMDVCDYLADKSFADLEALIELARPVPPPKQRIKRSSFTYVGEAERHRSKLVQFVVKDTRLRRRGGELVGLCPFHEERTPSFFVNVERGVYHCQGCKRSGDVINYLKDKRGLTFKQALRLLERSA